MDDAPKFSVDQVVLSTVTIIIPTIVKTTPGQDKQYIDAA